MPFSVYDAGNPAAGATSRLRTNGLLKNLIATRKEGDAGGRPSGKGTEKKSISWT
jgi:hypothetical protein